jgi:hypothetical protein
MEQVKAMTTMSLSNDEMRDRLLADKAALEVKLKDMFDGRRFAVKACAPNRPSPWYDEVIKSISAELRAVKANLKLVGG